MRVLRPRAGSPLARTSRSVWIGRDEWGTAQHLNLSGVAGITCGGLPGYGKTSLALTALCQLAPSAAAQFAIVDGKGGGDYDDWGPRAALSCGDDLDEAAGVLDTLYEHMRDRQSRIRSELGSTNFWAVGPSVAWPVVFVLVDECHTFFPKSGKRDSRLDDCADKVEQLVKKGRSVGVVTLLLTQKQTGDSIPTSIRDVCEVCLSFACKTSDASVAALGQGIREHPGVCPTTLQDRAHVGVCVASLPGVPGFVRLRVPYVDPGEAGRLAAATAHLRRDLDDGHGSESVEKAA